MTPSAAILRLPLVRRNRPFATHEESQREKDYLQNVMDGKIQLVAYAPENGNLIEMIGTLSPETTAVLTYVPGTFATAEDFFRAMPNKST